MKQKIKNIIKNALKDAYDKGDLPSSNFLEIEVEEPKAGFHGDFSTNISMVMASIQKMPPRKIADAIIKNINDPGGMLDKTEIAGPGFINFFLNKYSWHPILQKIHEQDALYGASNIGKGKKIQVEFVSANPTGPLHVGHGRGAAVGDSVANILLFCGYKVEKEYYINDSGRQINTLGRSVFLRYKELFKADVQFPEDCYQGDYVRDLARRVKENKEDELFSHSEEDAIKYCARFAAKDILSEIKEDLKSFGVVFDNWYSEQGLYDSGKVDKTINDFRKQNIIFEDDGALWFRTKNFGDEKNRVVVRSNGLTTYFASDIAYHQDKFDRGFERIIDVWGADHHGYIPRVSAAIEASGHTRDKFDVILIQLVNLQRDGVPVAMSTRAGEFVTLRDVINEVGSDAARFIFLTRHYESALDFDLELAKKKTNDNPVYYVQYVHARISSIVRKAQERGINEIVWNDAAISGLNEPEEIQLIKIMARYPEIVRCSAEYMEPHRITYYLMNLASAFHAYYNKHRVLTDEAELTIGRLYLVLAIKKIIRNGLSLLGVSAPEKM
ncbi:MAG: arginine--tRNA ligase [Desulfobacteraceae bacterium]|nr:arginine--tRNA ligase [Desulfobacteraceae bacterium]MBC2720982.1 arginine--tRNA ligase [Desulfobacteraceae bacterium]